MIDSNKKITRLELEVGDNTYKYETPYNHVPLSELFQSFYGLLLSTGEYTNEEIIAEFNTFID